MWSGPRNLSTAMMYSFGARADFAVWDEPFYAAYLAATDIDHPMREEILTAHDTDPGKIAAQCGNEYSKDDRHLYMKHMCHHMVDEFDIEWARSCKNVFLIRHPARVVASYVSKREEPTLGDIGIERQLEILNLLCAWGCDPIVIDSFDIRRNPRLALRSLCDAIDIEFDEAMLKWSPGPKPYDGVWGPHWYGAVHMSTGFAGPEGPLPELAGDLNGVAQQALPFYDALYAKRLGAPRP
ncbi:MAG: HAD family hydrolase [Boseongicola sp.]